MQTKQTEAVNQQLSVLTALIGSQTASYLVPNYNDGQKLAIIDEGVLKYLTELLPKANAYEIISALIGNLTEERRGNCKLEKAVAICKDFVAFHEGVNLMKKYFDPNVKVEYEAPFNQPIRELTITELIEHRNALVEELAKLDEKINAYNQSMSEQTGPTVVERGSKL